MGGEGEGRGRGGEGRRGEGRREGELGENKESGIKQLKRANCRTHRPLHRNTGKVTSNEMTGNTAVQ